MSTTDITFFRITQWIVIIDNRIFEVSRKFDNI